MTTQTFTKMAPPQWLLDMWKEIDEKTFGKGFDCFAENAVCNRASPTGTDAKRSVPICAPSLTPGSPPITRWSNTGTARGSRSFMARSE